MTVTVAAAVATDKATAKGPLRKGCGIHNPSDERAVAILYRSGLTSEPDGPGRGDSLPPWISARAGRTARPATAVD